MAKTNGAAALTDKQLWFVREYLVDCNGKRAAIAAGYSEKGAEVTASKLLTNPKVKAAVQEGQKRLAEKTETTSEKIRRRLWEESEDYSEFATHSGRIRALELLAKINGEFEKDNSQKASPLDSLLKSLTGNVMGPKKGS